jgi:hypothetical protein
MPSALLHITWLDFPQWKAEALIHHQDIICCVACVRSSLRRIGPYASVVAPWRLASDALLVIRNLPKPADSYKEP